MVRFRTSIFLCRRDKEIDLGSAGGCCFWNTRQRYLSATINHGNSPITTGYPDRLAIEASRGFTETVLTRQAISSDDNKYNKKATRTYLRTIVQRRRRMANRRARLFLKEHSVPSIVAHTAGLAMLFTAIFSMWRQTGLLSIRRYSLVSHVRQLQQGEQKKDIYDYAAQRVQACLLYTSPSPRDQRGSRMPSSA